MAGLFGGAKPVNQAAPVIASLRVQTSAYGGVIPICFGMPRLAGNLLQYENFTAIAHTSTQSSGGKGGDAEAASNTTYTYTAMVLLRLAMVEIRSIPRVWRNKNLTSLAALGLTLFEGSYSQNPFAPLLSAYPARALSYRGLAYVAAEALDLGSDASIGNLNFEVRAPRPAGVGGKELREVRIQQGAASYNRIASALLQSSTDGLSWSTIATLSLPDDGAEHAHAIGASSVKPFWRLLANANVNGWLGAWDPDTVYGADDVVTYDGDIWWCNAPASLVTGRAPFDEYDVAVDWGDAGGWQWVSSGWHRIGGAGARWDVVTFEMATAGAGADIALQENAIGNSNGAANAFDGSTDTYWRSAEAGAAVSGAAWIGQEMGVLDANPKDVIYDLLLDPHFGAGFPAARVGDWSAYADYCTAAGIFVSPAYTEQEACADLIGSLLKISNSEIVYSEGVLKIIPRGDAALSGNGETYTPNLTPAYQLTDAHFLPNEDEPPVKVRRKVNANAYNHVIVEICNRDNEYAVEPFEAKDEAHIDTYGLRTMDVVRIREVVDPVVGRAVAQLILQRELNVRNEYEFRLDFRFSKLEAMDIVGLTDSDIGCVQHPVRIVSVEDGNDDGDDGLTVVAEDLSTGSSAAENYGAQAGAALVKDYNVAPGDANAPVFVDAPAALAVSGYELWMGISGASPNWGGAEVWIAQAPEGPYQQAGAIFGPSRYGELTATFPTGLDPDTVNTCSVDLSASKGELTGGTQSEADNLATLAIVNREFVSFTDAVLTGAYEYGVEGYLRRGVFNTPVGEHAAGERFVRLDQSIFRYPYDPLLVGKQIFVKLPSFNVHGFGQQQLSEVPAYAYVLNGASGFPDDVTGFVAAQNGANMLFDWDTPNDDSIIGWELRYSDSGASWDDAIPMTKVTRGSSETSLRIPPGSYIGYIKAKDRGGSYSLNAVSVSFTVTSDYPETYSNQAAPGWEERDVAVETDGTATSYVSFSTNAQGPVTSPPPTQNCSSWSTSLGVAATAPASTGYLLDAHASNQGYALKARPNGELSVFFGDGVSTVSQDIAAVVADGADHYIFVTQSTAAAEAKVYVDKVLVATVSLAGLGNVMPENNTYRIGVGRDGTGPVALTMGELILWRNSVADQARVNEVYEGQDVGVGFITHVSSVGSKQSGVQCYHDFRSSDVIRGQGFSLNGTAKKVAGSFTSKMVLHPSGVLVPDDKYPLSHYETFEEEDALWANNPFRYLRWRLTPFALAVSNGLERYYGKPRVQALPVGVTVKPKPPFVPILQSNDSTAKPGGLIAYDWGDYSIGVAPPYLGSGGWSRLRIDTGRLKRNSSLLAPSALSAIVAFEEVVDLPPLVQRAENVVIGPTGTAIVFPIAYHTAPNVVPVALGAGLFAVPSGITNTGFTAHIYNAAGAEVGGTLASWLATGN